MTPNRWRNWITKSQMKRSSKAKLSPLPESSKRTIKSTTNPHSSTAEADYECLSPPLTRALSLLFCKDRLSMSRHSLLRVNNSNLLKRLLESQNPTTLQSPYSNTISPESSAPNDDCQATQNETLLLSSSSSPPSATTTITTVDWVLSNGWQKETFTLTMLSINLVFTFTPQKCLSMWSPKTFFE